MKNENMIYLVIILIGLLVIVFVIGIDYRQRYINIKDNYMESQESFEKLDGKWYRNSEGDWVCVNVEGMSYERALEVVRHEIFHEIWAECGESNDLEYCINKHEMETKELESKRFLQNTWKK